MGILDAPGVSPKQLAPVSADAWRALAQGTVLTSRLPATVTTPAVSWATTNTLTPTQRAAYLYAATPPQFSPAFTLSGYPYDKAGPNTPERDGVGSQILAGTGTVNYGSADADFLSDSPILAIPYFRSQGGFIRIVVDGVETIRVGAVQKDTATAAAGSTSTTLVMDSGGSSLNGFYATRWVGIIGGTGAGQVRQIVSYVGSTKTATVNTAWTTTPDNTSTFYVSATRMTWNNNYTTTPGIVYLTMDWSGERRMRHYRVETWLTYFLGCYTTSPADQVVAAPKPTGPRCIWLGDSFSSGTGSDNKEGLAWIAARRLGWEIWNLSVGGTGYLNGLTGGGAMNFRTRCFPSYNSWQWNRRYGATGSMTLTQGATSVTIPSGASAAAIQTLMDTAFGTGAWSVWGGASATATAGTWFVANGALASVTTAMTPDATYTAANPNASFTRWAGDLAPAVPLDVNGQPLPFVMVLAGGHNDTTGTAAGYTPSVLQAETSTLITQIQTAYPTAIVIVVGFMFLSGSSATTAGGAWDTAMLTATTASAKLVNGQVPYLPLLNLFTGSGRLGSLQNDGTSDYATHTDGVHPSPIGHYVYGTKIASQINALLGRS